MVRGERTVANFWVARHSLSMQRMGSVAWLDSSTVFPVASSSTVSCLLKPGLGSRYQEDDHYFFNPEIQFSMMLIGWPSCSTRVLIKKRLPSGDTSNCV